MVATLETSLLTIGVCLQILHIHGWVAEDTNIYACQGKKLNLAPCKLYDNKFQGVMKIKSVTVLTNTNSSEIMTDASQGCARSEQCRRVIQSMEDIGLTMSYKYLYQWVLSRCEGKASCDQTNGSLPEWWQLVTDENDNCNSTGTHYFASVLIHRQCKVAEPPIPTLSPPPPTEPQTKPTTPTTTTPFPVYISIYLPDLIGREKVILGIAIGLSLAILLVLLIVLYCCEKYRNHKKFGKLLRMLGAPQAQDDAFDELEFGRKDAWQDETQNLDALGEYTGVKPDEFLTLDKQTMERTGQIMYDTPTGSMHQGNSCSTLDRLDRKQGPSAKLLAGYNYEGPTDYNTEENKELESRMAATLAQTDENTEESSNP